VDTGCGCWTPAEVDVLGTGASDTGSFAYDCSDAQDCCAAMRAVQATTTAELAALMAERTPDRNPPDVSTFDPSTEVAIFTYTESCWDRPTVALREARVCGDGRLDLDFLNDANTDFPTSYWGNRRQYFVLTAPGTGFPDVSTRTIRNCSDEAQQYGFQCHVEIVE
jgi:hypothetical protein